MAEEKQIKLKYLPTGNVFTLPEAEARRIYIEDKGFNYEIIEGEIKLEEPEVEETTVYNEIVEENNSTGQASEASSNSPVDSEKAADTEEKTKSFEQWTIPELKAKLDTMNIQYTKNAKKADLLALLKDNLTTKETQGE